MTFEDVKRIRDNPTFDDIDNKELQRMIDIAVEKQIPKKANEETINRGIDITGEHDIECNLCCHICGAVVGTFESGEDEYFYKYCPECGQALDWS